MQPFQLPRPNTIPGGARPGVPRPGMPGPQQGARPGVPRPGMPGPMGVKPQIPSNIGVNHPVTNQIPQEEKPKEPVETIQQEPVQEEVPEQKAEPIKTEPPVKVNRPGPPQFGQKPMPKPGMKPGPHFGQPPSQPMTKQPEIPTKQPEPEQVAQRKPSLKPEIEPPQQKPPVQVQHQEVAEQIPQRKPSYKQEVEPVIPQRKPSFKTEIEPPQQKPPVQESHQAGSADYSNDRLLRLSESLQAMKDLRSNFQGFNPAEEEDQEEEQYAEEEYAEEDDYVRVEGTEDEEGLGDTANEGQRYSDENQEEEDFEDNQNQDYQEQEDEDYEPEDQGNSESQNQLAEPQYPPQIIEEEAPEETPKAHIEASPERKFPPPMARTLPPAGPFGMRPSPHGSAGLKPPGSAGVQPVGSAGIKPQSAGIQPKAQTSAGGINSPFREEKNIIHHQTQHRSKYATESQELLTSHEGIGHGSGKKDSDYERIEHEAAMASGRNDPNLILKLERLELELEKEKKKSALLEEQQEQVLNENQGLKQRNAELTARLELANKRSATSEQSSSHPESDALRQELTRSLEETRQVSENAQRMMQEATQYREETESFISTLESEKNDLYQQVVQLKRQVDQDYVHQIESYKQRIELLERKIKDHENNFSMVTGQLREKSSTIQKITSLNTEIQSALSTLHEPFSSELLYQSRDFNLLPHDFTTKSNQKSIDFPRPQAEFIHKEEPNKPSFGSEKKQQHEEKVSSEGLIAPPQNRLPNKAKKEEQPKPQAVPFKAPPQIQTQPKQPENISIIHYEESKPSPSPSKLIAGKSKLHAKTNKNPFADEEEPLGSPNVVDESAVNYDQQFIEEPAQQYYAEEQGYTEGGQDEPLDEIAEAQDFFNDLSHQAQKEIHSGGLLNTSKQSKSSLRYSANQVPGENTENQGGALTQEAAENFFDQLGNNQNSESPNETPTQIRTDPYQYNQPKPQVQAKPVQQGTNPFADEAAEEEAPPVSQPQKQVHQQVPPKKVVQSSAQKGKNPFDDEQEDSSSQFQVPPPQTQTRQVPQQTTKQLPPPRNVVPTSSHKGTNPFAEENEAESQLPVQAKPVVRATPQRGKNPFDDEGETPAQGSEFFQQQQPQTQAQPRTQVPPQNRAQQQQQPFPKPGQPKAGIKRGNNPFADEEEEKNVQPQVRAQPPVQQYQQPPVQSKHVSRGPIQKGNNPFAEESEGQNPFDTPEAGSFVDRPEVQRPNQPKTLPLQTAVAKKLDVQPSKGSALKKAKGVIPSSMFD